MKVGLTGATGFVGSALLAEGRRRGWRIIAFSRTVGKVAGADETRSLSDPERIDLGGLDALIHLAGEPIAGLWTKDRKRRIHESRVDLTGDLVEALAALPVGERPSRFVSASAIGYYGDRGGEFLDETSDPGFGFLPMVCRDWEETAARATGLGIRLVNPRIGLVLGQGGFLEKVRPLFRWSLGGRLGGGRQWMSWIHVEDLARVFAECVENPALHGPVNAVAPNPVTNRQFTASYARVLGRVAWLPVPAFVLRRLPGGMGALFLDSQRVEPVALRAFGFTWKHADLESALREVEFPGGAMPEGLNLPA